MLHRFFLCPGIFFACVEIRATLELESLECYIFLKLFWVEARWPMIVEAPTLSTGHDRACLITWAERLPIHGLLLAAFEDRFVTQHCTMQWADEHTETIYQDAKPLCDKEYTSYYDQPSPTLLMTFA